MKKVFVFLVTAFLYLLISIPVLAAGEDVGKVQSFIQSVIQVLVTLAGLVSAGFFVWGGIGYITSSESRKFRSIQRRFFTRRLV